MRAKLRAASARQSAPAGRQDLPHRAAGPARHGRAERWHGPCRRDGVAHLHAGVPPPMSLFGSLHHRDQRPYLPEPRARPRLGQHRQQPDRRLQAGGHQLRVLPLAVGQHDAFAGLGDGPAGLHQRAAGHDRAVGVAAGDGDRRPGLLQRRRVGGHGGERPAALRRPAVLLPRRRFQPGRGRLPRERLRLLPPGLAGRRRGQPGPHHPGADPRQPAGVQPGRRPAAWSSPPTCPRTAPRPRGRSAPRRSSTTRSDGSIR